MARIAALEDAAKALKTAENAERMPEIEAIGSRGTGHLIVDAQKYAALVSGAEAALLG